MTPQEVAEKVVGLYTNMNITPYATVNGVTWTCEILNLESEGKTSGVCVEFCDTLEDAVTQAYEEFCNTEGSHMLQRLRVEQP